MFGKLIIRIDTAPGVLLYTQSELKRGISSALMDYRESVCCIQTPN